MTHNNYINKLYKKREDILRICKYYGVVGYQADDIEQDLYIKLLNYENIDKYLLNGEPNMYIIFAIVRNLIFDYKKFEKRYTDEYIIETEDKYENLPEQTINKYNYVLNEIEKIPDHFSKTLIKIYYFNEHSIRSLSKDSGIGVRTIQPIIRKFKLELQQKSKNINFSF